MTFRTSLTLGLVVAVCAAPRAARATEGESIEWRAGGATNSSASAANAAELDWQAARLAATASTGAASAPTAQPAPATAPQAPATAAATPGSNTTAANTAPSAAAAETRNASVTPAGIDGQRIEERQSIVDIRFRGSELAPQAEPAPAAIFQPAGTPAAPATSVSTVPPAEPAVPPAQSPAVVTSNAAGARPAFAQQLSDSQVQLAAQLLPAVAPTIRTAQVEPLPMAPTASATQDAPNGSQSLLTQQGMDACCDTRPMLFWVGGVEATFLTPDLNRSPVSFQRERIDVDGSDIFTGYSNSVDSVYIAPRIWVGVQGCAWGANLRYWHMQASEGSYDPSIGGLGTWDDYDCGIPDIGYFTCSRFEAYTVDLELTRRFCLHDCWMQASVGLRHAEIEHHESFTGLANTEEGLLEGFARANRYTRGTGVALGLYGRKPLFPCSCVNWFYNVRWSALWGPTQTAAETFAAVHAGDPDFTASAASVNGASTYVDDTLFIGEVQLGLEWNYALRCLPANAFWRVAIEYQRWDGGLGVSTADSFAGITIDGDVDPTSIASTSAIAAKPQLDLFGFTIGAGLTW
jgi:hypothetical protein